MKCLSFILTDLPPSSSPTLNNRLRRSGSFSSRSRSVHRRVAGHPSFSGMPRITDGMPRASYCCWKVSTDVVLASRMAGTEMAPLLLLLLLLSCASVARPGMKVS